jgi:hypothetical protein
VTDSRNRSIFAVIVSFVVVLGLAQGGAAGDKALTFEELMQFRQIRNAVISDDGGWVAYALVPDRGDGVLVVRSTTDGTEHRIERGADPEISKDGRWVAAAITPTLEEIEKAGAKKGDKEKDKPKKGLALFDLTNGVEERIDGVESFAFSEDGRWLACKLAEEKGE